MGWPQEDQPPDRRCEKIKSVVAALYERLNFSTIRLKKPFVERCYNIFSQLHTGGCTTEWFSATLQATLKEFLRSLQPKKLQPEPLYLGF